MTTATNPYQSPPVAQAFAAREGLRYYGFGASNVLLGALAMLGTLPGRTHGLGLITEYLLADLQLDRNTYSVVNLVATLLGALACFPAGMLIDRLGTRWSLVLVSFALGATCWLMTGMTGLLALCVLVTLTRALGQSALSVVSMAVVGKWFHRHVGVAMSIYSVLVSVLFMSAFKYVGTTVVELGWRTAWSQIALALMFGLAPLAALAVRSRPKEAAANDDDPATDAAAGMDGYSLGAALRTPAFWIFALAASFYGLVSSGMGLWNQAILAEHGFDAATYHNTLVLTTFVSLGGQVLAGLLGMRLPMGRVLACAMFIYAAALIWLTRSETLLALRIYAVMMGLAGGVVIVLFFAIWPQAFGRASLGKIQGAAQMLTVVASAVGPLLFSGCHALTGSYSPALRALAPIVVFLGVAAWHVRMPGERDHRSRLYDAGGAGYDDGAKNKTQLWRTCFMSIATAPVRFHCSLNVSDLERSVDFYRLLFGREPAKLRPDYAKFETDDPPLVLSLEPTPPSRGGSLNHLGLRVGDSAALVEIQRRFEAAGTATQREEGVECCYALQTKFWVTDPDQNLWELYILHEDLDHRGVGQTIEQMVPGGLTAEEPRPAPAIWQHTLGMDVPQRLPQDDASIDEVQLHGTFNAALADDVRDRLLQEVQRILKPAGKLMVHTLVGNREFAGQPNLPGPAAFVEAVPVDSQLFASLEQAGFANLYLEKFGSSPCFVAGGVEMRELKLWADKPAAAAGQDDRFVLYKGPLKQVQDDQGTVYPRGQRVRVGPQQWAPLKNGPAAEAFVFFSAEALVTLGKCATASRER